MITIYLKPCKTRILERLQGVTKKFVKGPFQPDYYNYKAISTTSGSPNIRSYLLKYHILVGNHDSIKLHYNNGHNSELFG